MHASEPALRPFRRRWLLTVVGLIVALLVARPAPAQDAEIVVASPDASAPIISTGIGEVPTTGGRRPGPFDEIASVGERAGGVAPVALVVERAGIDAAIERLKVIDGAMQDPTGPWAVAWYENLSALGRGGNVVMAGHVDYWNVGPAVFYSIDQLVEGDQITVIGEDGETFTYEVEWVRQYEADNLPLDEVVGPTTTESLTLITCGGTFDYTNAHYLHRTVVRATQVAD